MAGYKKAAAKATEILETLKVESAAVKDPRDIKALTAALKPVCAAKQYGYEDKLAGLVAEAAATVMRRPPKQAALNTDNVRVAKLIGGSLAQSTVRASVVVY